ncbi:MAG: isochorismate synthase [Bdellovibrionota bacterium]
MEHIDSYLNINLFPQFYFQQRDTHKIFIGLGEVPLSQDFFQRFQTLPEELVFFYNQLFNGNKPYVTLPRFQIQIDGSDVKVHTVFKEPLPSQKLETSSHPPVVATRFDKPKKSDWLNLFTKIHEKFQDETFRKIVPARKVTVDLEQNLNILEFFKKIMKDSNYNYMIRTSEHSAFMGSSPERLLFFQDSKFQTEAIAGTRPKELAHELLESEKDLYEHNLVVEDIIAKLKPFSEKIHSEKTAVIDAKNLAHLKTKITATPSLGNTQTGNAQSKNIFNVIESLHPTSAVCGMPKRESINFLRESESFDRGLFASPFGVFNRKFTDICVAIRCCHIEKNRVDLFSGVGVVPQSNPESEWQELEHKIQPYLDLLGIHAEDDISIAAPK